MTTQIFYLEVDADKRMDNCATEAGRLWSNSLGLFQTAQGFQRLYWGCRLEEPEKVQLHIGSYEHTHPRPPPSFGKKRQKKIKNNCTGGPRLYVCASG